MRLAVRLGLTDDYELEAVSGDFKNRRLGQRPDSKFHF